MAPPVTPPYAGQGTPGEGYDSTEPSSSGRKKHPASPTGAYDQDTGRSAFGPNKRRVSPYQHAYNSRRSQSLNRIFSGFSGANLTPIRNPRQLPGLHRRESSSPKGRLAPHENDPNPLKPGHEFNLTFRPARPIGPHQAKQRQHRPQSQSSKPHSPRPSFDLSKAPTRDPHVEAEHIRWAQTCVNEIMADEAKAEKAIRGTNFKPSTPLRSASTNFQQTDSFLTPQQQRLGTAVSGNRSLPGGFSGQKDRRVSNVRAPTSNRKPAVDRDVTLRTVKSSGTLPASTARNDSHGQTATKTTTKTGIYMDDKFSPVATMDEVLRHQTPASLYHHQFTTYDEEEEEKEEGENDDFDENDNPEHLFNFCPIGEVSESLAKLHKSSDHQLELVKRLGRDPDVKPWTEHDVPEEQPEHVKSRVREFQNEVQNLSDLLDELEEKKKQFNGLDILQGGSASPMVWPYLSLYEQNATLEEALRRETPVTCGQLSGTRGYWMKPAIVRAVPIKFLTEDDEGWWKPEWLSLRGQDFDLQHAERQLKRATDEQKRLRATRAEKQQLDDIARRVKQCTRAKRQIQLIRTYFCEGVTIHPNQLVSKDIMPKNGLCKRYLLYNICLVLHRLVGLRDLDQEIGLRMPPVDFLRWRLAVSWHRKAPGISHNMRSFIFHLSHPEDGKKRGCDAIFREAVLRGAKLQNDLYMYQRERKTKGKREQQGGQQQHEEDDPGGQRKVRPSANWSRTKQHIKSDHRQMPPLLTPFHFPPKTSSAQAASPPSIAAAMFLQRSAATVARRAAVSPMARRAFTTSIAHRESSNAPATPPSAKTTPAYKPFNEIKTEDDLFGPGAKAGTIPTDLEQSTGLERLEILGKMEGVDVFDMRPLDASRTGTMENPIHVRSAGDEQYLGCTGSPADSHNTLWLTISRERPIERCPECGSVYKMDYIGPQDDHHGHHDHHGHEDVKTFADFVKPEYHYT